MKLDHEDLNRLIEKISTSDIQEFSLEGEDFKLEIKRNLFDQSQVINNLVSNTSFDKPTIANQKPITDNIPIVNEPEAPQVAPPGRSDQLKSLHLWLGHFIGLQRLVRTHSSKLEAMLRSVKLFVFWKL